MKPKLNYWRTICFINVAIFSLCLFNVAVAQDQNPPSGMDKGVWVLKEKKPDFEPVKDEPTYFNNHVSVSGNSVNGGWSWKDDPVKPECSGEVWGTCSWEEIPLVIQPGVGQNTTLNAEVGGSQSCAYRHVSARTELAINDQNLDQIYAQTGYATSDPKPAPVSVKVPWEAPWGKIGDTLTITVIAQVPGAVSNHFYYNYIYAYEAPGSQPKNLTSPNQPTPVEQQRPVPSPMPSNEPSWCPCGGGDSGVRFSDISGQVDVRPDCKVNAWKVVELATMPCVDDHVRTGEDSSAILSFADMTTLVMKPETEIMLDVVPQKDAKISLVAGNIWENVKKMIREGQMEVEMSQAVTGIKGTTIVCEEMGSSSTLKVLEGTASFRSKATGEEIQVNAGEMATATVNGLSQPRSFDVNAEKASWEDLASEPESTGPSNAAGKVLLDTWNQGLTDSNPSCSPSFAIDQPYNITCIETYHWNQGQGTEMGGTISLVKDDGATAYGPWKAQAEPGMNGEPNVLWKSHPNVVIPPGSYTVIDSDPATWSQNTESKGCGFCRIEGHQAEAAGNLSGTDEVCMSDWTGTWVTDWGEMRLQQSGDQVAGSYAYDQGRIEGTASGDIFQGTWSKAPSYSEPNDAGEIEIMLSDDCQSLIGFWRNSSIGDWMGGWTGMRKQMIEPGLDIGS